MEEKPEEVRVKREVIWQNVLLFIYLHMSAMYGLFLVFTHAKFMTVLYTFVLIVYSTLSVTLGCHRLWAHNAYEAPFLTKLFFVIGHTLTCQGSVYDWVRDHRIHHKYHGTEMDPYNYKRGFIFSQLGCRMVTSNPELKKVKDEIDMSDIEKDGIVMWQKTLYWLVMPIVGLLLPINAAVEYWNESMLVSIFVVGFFRLAVSLHSAWLINSSVIVWGLDPLDRRAADTSLIFLVNKSYWPLYHYLVTWDYQVGEYGNYGNGFCNAILRVFAALGWVYDLKSIDTNGIRRAVYESTKTGKPLMQCIQDQKNVATFSEMIASVNKEHA